MGLGADIVVRAGLQAVMAMLERVFYCDEMKFFYSLGEFS